MKQEDINRLKEICEKEGFEVLESPFDHGIFKIGTKKDPWKGVEFGRVKGTREIIRFNECQYLDKNKEGYYTFFELFVPATESEYFEQLKKEAFERFGEICNSDQFDCSMWGGSRRAEYTRNANKWRYEKKHDILTLDHFCLYNSGKWATKLPKKAKVKFITSSGMSNNGENGKFIGGDYKFKFKIENVEHKNLHHIGDFLAKQLENYLNDNQE